MFEALTSRILMLGDPPGGDWIKKKENYSPLAGCAMIHLYWRHIGGSLDPSNTST